MSANAEIIAELRRVLNERDEAREQLDLTKRELGRWVDRETKAVRERDEAHERNTDLRTMLEQVTRERDEARERLAGLPAWQHACEQSRLDLAEAEAVIARRDTLLDEARAEVERLNALLSNVTAENQYRAQREACALQDWQALRAECDEARAEVERLRVELIRAGSRECDIAACNCGTWHHQNPRAAYRRGAEAMREACQQWCRAWENNGEAIADALADLRVEDKP